MITIKGLYALCLVHNVSITYVYGRKYCELLWASEAAPSEAAPSEAAPSEAAPSEAAPSEAAPSEAAPSEAPIKKGIILQNEKKEDSLKWTSNENNTNDDFFKKIQSEYWHIENIQKPLNAPSAYTLAELQDICQKLQIETHIQSENVKLKAKTKTKLYEEILECM
jgi:hypothetical protein